MNDEERDILVLTEAIRLKPQFAIVVYAAKDDAAMDLVVAEARRLIWDEVQEGY